MSAAAFASCRCSAALVRKLGPAPVLKGDRPSGAFIVIMADDGSVWLWRVDPAALDNGPQPWGRRV